MDDTAKLIALVALAAFATERILATANYLLDSERAYRLKHAIANKLRLRERRKILLLCLAGAIALAVVDWADVRILRKLDRGNALWPLDYWLTWLVVFAGADRVSSLLQGVTKASVPSKAKETPAVRIRVEGAAEIRELRQAS